METDNLTQARIKFKGSEEKAMDTVSGCTLGIRLLTLRLHKIGENCLSNDRLLTSQVGICSTE